MHGNMEPRVKASKAAAVMVEDECVVADMSMAVMLSLMLGGSSCVRQFVALSRHFDQRRPLSKFCLGTSGSWSETELSSQTPS